MKRTLYFALALLTALGMAACGAPSADVSASEKVSASAPVGVVFTDAALEAKVREAMGKPEGDITLEEAEAVTELDLSNEWQPGMPEDKMISDISSLKFFPNLISLRLTFNAVSDISVLADLGSLKTLDLGGNKLGDISPLSRLKGLVDLQLFGNGLKDISALGGLTQMRSLFIHSNQLTDISEVAGMKNLDLLMASDNQITDISPLAGLPLTRLYLNNNPIADFSPIADIYDTLTEKDFEILSANDIPDEPLVFDDPKFEKALRTAMGIAEGPITQRDAYLVQSLKICNDKTEGSAFSDISPLKHFVNLKSLYFNSNLISDLTPLSGLTKLTNLDIGFNKVADLTPLAGLTQLESLKLTNNQITDVSALAGLTNLWELWIAENPVTDYSPLANIYPNLKSKDFELK